MAMLMFCNYNYNMFRAVTLKVLLTTFRRQTQRSIQFICEYHVLLKNYTE